MTKKGKGAMPRRGPMVIGAALLMAGGALSVATPAAAQFSTGLGRPVVGTAPPPKQAPLPPPGVPGAAALPGAAPRAPQAKEISPTDELFDAINRGDLATARDAIGRGAQLDAKNILGMTPLEDAVDLNRNDIAFLLLSIEHEHTAAAHSANASLSMSAPPTAAALPETPGKAANSANSTDSVADLLVANGAPPASLPTGHALRAADPPVRAAPAVSAAPVAVLSGGGEGGPNPTVGFLGFGPRAGGVGATQN